MLNLSQASGCWSSRTLLAAIGAAVVALAVSMAPAAVAAAKPARPAKLAPAWELKDLEGKPVKSADFKGKVVILDFWATWCGPCKKEIPGFIELQDKYGKDGLVIIGVSLDDGPGLVKRFYTANKMNYPVVMGNEQVTKDFGGVEGIPTTFIIDRDGAIAGKHVGYAEKSAFEKEIKPLLAPAK